MEKEPTQNAVDGTFLKGCPCMLQFACMQSWCMNYNMPTLLSLSGLEECFGFIRVCETFYIPTAEFSVNPALELESQTTVIVFCYSARRGSDTLKLSHFMQYCTYEYKQ